MHWRAVLLLAQFITSPALGYAMRMLGGRLPAFSPLLRAHRRWERCTAVHGISSTSSSRCSSSCGIGGDNSSGGAASSAPATPAPASATYDHLAVEAKWQKYWEDHSVFVSKALPGKKKKYVLDMFPYPSGSGLHVGHPEGYTATDILARYWRMKGFDVLHPMGWDAFGLPAEQHAIATGKHPKETTLANIAVFKRQLKALGFSYDWTRELSTTDDGYVKWTQWIFLQLFKKGLANQSEILVNWCSALGTVLANEEVINGLSERGSHPVERIPLRQWVLRITEYADKLEDTSALQWPEGTLVSQKQWIGRSEGATIKFRLEDESCCSAKELEVFSTRPETIMGCSVLLLSPDHPLVAQLTSASQRQAVEAYRAQITGVSDLDRTTKGRRGVFTGSYCLHPLTGERLPIWLADYVLIGYGTGAVMAVPAHDERDFEFAQVHGLPVKRVVSGGDSLPHLGAGVVENSGPELDGLSTNEACSRAVALLENRGLGQAKTAYRLRDWVFSRQRYWGEPIPVYFPVEMLEPGSPIDGARHRILYDQPHAVDESELPLLLPEMSDFQPGDDPHGCLARALHWRFFQRDGKWFARETNTMPQWAGSCWYYLRFCDPHNPNALIGQEAKSWLPVDVYVGGQEHAVLHLLYARFWHKVLHDLGIVDHSEPFSRLVHQGMILGRDGEKMSKSRGNVVNPDDVVREHGADALRLYEMFMGPLEASKPWQTEQMLGVVRFRDRVLSLMRQPRVDEPVQGALFKEMHRAMTKVTEDIERMSFNTAISSLMILSNALSAHAQKGPIPRGALETLVLLLSPFAPHVAEECWQRLGHNKTLAYEPWPTASDDAAIDDSPQLVVQVNGKVRAVVQVARDLSEEQAIAAARAEPKILALLKNSTPRKVIYKANKVLNFVL